MEFIESFQRFQLNFHRNSCIFSFTHNFVLFLIKFNNYNKKILKQNWQQSLVSIQLNWYFLTVTNILPSWLLITSSYYPGCMQAPLCPTLCNPMDCVACQAWSSVHGISQTWVLEWVVIPSSGDLPNPGIEPASSALPDRFFTTAPPGKSSVLWVATVWASLVAQQ